MGSFPVPPDFTRDDVDPGSISPTGFTTLSPLVFDVLTKRLSVLDASAMHNGVVSTIAQTFTGAKTFSAVPSCAIKPTLPEHLTNKGYVDSMSRGQSWMDPVIAFIDFTTIPTSSTNKDRYVALANNPPFTKDNIYEWNAADVEWTEIVPKEGDALWVRSDTGLHANTQVVFDGTNWVSTGTTISHNSLVGAGTLTHATIDSYLNQALLTTSSPSFSSVAATATTTSTSTKTGALTVAGGVGISENLNVGGLLRVTDTTESSTTLTGCATFAGVGIAGALRVGNFMQSTSRFEVLNATEASSTGGSIRTNGGISAIKGGYFGGSVSIASATASTSSSTGALTVVGGAVYVDGSISCGADATVTGRVTAAIMTCSTAPSAATDVIRLSDFSALVDQDVRTTATPTWPVVTVTGAFPDYHTFAATGGVRGGLYRRTVYDTQVDSDETHPSIISLFTSTAPDTPITAGYKRWRHAIFGVNAGGHGPSIGALVIDSVAGNSDDIYNERATELSNIGTKWFSSYRPALIAMPTFGVQHNAIADADRTTKAFLALVPGDKTSVQNATITYFQDTASNGNAYIRFGNTRDSTSSTTGGVVFDCGVGIAKNAYVGGLLRVTDATESTSTTTGCAVFTGGISVGGNAVIGADLQSNQASVIGNASVGGVLSIAGQSAHSGGAHVGSASGTTPYPLQVITQKGTPQVSITSNDSGTIAVATLSVDQATNSLSVRAGDSTGIGGVIYLGADPSTTSGQGDTVRVLKAPVGDNDVVRKKDLDAITPLAWEIISDQDGMWAPSNGGTARTQGVSLHRSDKFCCYYSRDDTGQIVANPREQTTPKHRKLHRAPCVGIFHPPQLTLSQL